jgi:hypothetical protein
MATGILTGLIPPSNNGTEAGQGKIMKENISYDFDTPTINHNRPLLVDKPCTFTLENGVVTSVTQDL